MKRLDIQDKTVKQEGRDKLFSHSLDFQTVSKDTIVQIEANIDNMNPEHYSYILEAILECGALDAWLTPIIMKKGRPAIKLSVLCSGAAFERVEAYIFKNTTTIGFRYFPVQRSVLERKFEEVNYQGHVIHIKSAYYGGECVNSTLEYEDLVQAGKVLEKPVKRIEKEVWAQINKNR